MISMIKSKLSSVDVLISKILIDCGVSHDEFVLTNIVLKNIAKKKSCISRLNPSFGLWSFAKSYQRY